MASALLGVLTISLLAGCGGGGGNGNSGGTTSTTGITNSTDGGNNSSSSANSVSATTTSGLIATLSEPSTTMGVGGTVTYTLSIRNPTATPIAVQSANPPGSTLPSATLVVRDATGAKVYEPNPPPAPAINVAMLAPGQTLSTTIAVSAYGTRGVYTATANFGETIPATTVGPLAVTAQ